MIASGTSSGEGLPGQQGSGAFGVPDFVGGEGGGGSRGTRSSK